MPSWFKIISNTLYFKFINCTSIEVDNSIAFEESLMVYKEKILELKPILEEKLEDMKDRYSWYLNAFKIFGEENRKELFDATDELSSLILENKSFRQLIPIVKKTVNLLIREHTRIGISYQEKLCLLEKYSHESMAKIDELIQIVIKFKKAEYEIIKKNNQFELCNREYENNFAEQLSYLESIYFTFNYVYVQINLSFYEPLFCFVENLEFKAEFLKKALDSSNHSKNCFKNLIFINKDIENFYNFFIMKGVSYKNEFCSEIEKIMYLKSILAQIEKWEPLEKRIQSDSNGSLKQKSAVKRRITIDEGISEDKPAETKRYKTENIQQNEMSYGFNRFNQLESSICDQRASTEPSSFANEIMDAEMD